MVESPVGQASKLGLYAVDSGRPLKGFLFKGVGWPESCFGRLPGAAGWRGPRPGLGGHREAIAITQEEVM